MCTLTYLPTEKGFTLTHNRDERKNRLSSPYFLRKEIEDKTIYFPQDLEARGTWMGFSDGGISACILNGGKHAYKRKNIYRKSRGLIVLESLEYNDPEEFYMNSNFSDIEPFTLIIRTPSSLFTIIHDENENNLEEYPVNDSRIWSSTTLYTEEVRNKREKWFGDWLKEKPALEDDIIKDFHLSAGEGNTENDLVMSRWGILQTVSLTQISVKEQEASLYYRNFMEKSKDELVVKIR